MRFVIVYFFLYMCSSISHCQTPKLRGCILSVDGIPIDNMSVRIESPTDTTISFSTLTDSLGKFECVDSLLDLPNIFSVYLQKGNRYKAFKERTFSSKEQIFVVQEHPSRYSYRRKISLLRDDVLKIKLQLDSLSEDSLMGKKNTHLERYWNSKKIYHDSLIQLVSKMKEMTFFSVLDSLSMKDLFAKSKKILEYTEFHDYEIDSLMILESPLKNMKAVDCRCIESDFADYIVVEFSLIYEDSSFVETDESISIRLLRKKNIDSPVKVLPETTTRSDLLKIKTLGDKRKNKVKFFSKGAFKTKRAFFLLEIRNDKTNQFLGELQLFNLMENCNSR